MPFQPVDTCKIMDSDVYRNSMTLSASIVQSVKRKAGMQGDKVKRVVSNYVTSYFLKRRMFAWLLTFAVINFLGQSVYTSFYKNMCSTQNSYTMITNTCHLYRSGVVDGSLCPALCDHDVLTFRHCVNWRFGKIVAYMDFNRFDGNIDTLVLKANLHPPDNNYTLYDFIRNKQNYTSKKLTASFKRNLVNLLKDKYDFSFDSLNFDVLTFMWGYNVTKYVSNSRNKTEALRTALRSIWYLVQQREYVFSKIHEKFSFATKIAGSCGPMYFLEFSKSLGELKSGLFRGRGLSVHTEDWKKRAEYAIKILQLLPTLQNSFRQPLEMCDIKEPNFGLRDNSNIVLIDSDDVHYRSSLVKELSAQPCSRHVHCGRLTCPGQCNKFAKRCRGQRTNNDLQSVCERVFLNKIGFANTGLLSGAPTTVKKELSNLLNKCAYPPSGISPTWDDRHVTHKPPDAMRLQLISVLQKGITS